MRKPILGWPRRAKLAGIGLAAAALVGGSLTYAQMAAAGTDNSGNTATPIKHVVVLFSENISYDHYFGTYPKAANTDGIPFTAAASAPESNNYQKNPTLLRKIGDGDGTNPNSIAPYRLGYKEAWTCSQNHGYTPEQKAVAGLKPDGTDNGTGTMSTFPENTIGGGCDAAAKAAAVNMGFYDGNTVTGLWNYAQNYAMSDNSWADNFGPSTVGALNVVAGQTGKAVVYAPTGDDADPTPLKDGTSTAPGVSNVSLEDGVNVGTVIGDPDPVYDDCSNNDHTGSANLAGMQGKNVGDLLNAKGVTWGWFQGGFAPTTPYEKGSYAKCDATSYNIHGATVTDYSPHHNPFAYYKSTANPHHLPPASPAEVGHNGQANHQYDLSYFDAAVANGTLPAVSYVKAAAYEDGHPSNSDPIDEQHFFTRTINELQKSPEWSSTAIVIAYDDSDGWYDHVAPTILNGSKTADDVNVCSDAANASNPMGGIQDRCGPSQRLPFLVISPYSRKNYIDHTKIGQSSVVRFIEDNWGLGRIGDGSFDATAGAITGMLDFAHPQNRSVLLNQNGTVSSIVDRTPAADNPPAGGNHHATPPVAAKARITKIGVVGVHKKVKVRKKIKASFLFAATGTVDGAVKLYDGKKAIASGTVHQNVAKVKFKLKKKGKHKLRLAFLGSSTVDPFKGHKFKIRAK